MKGIKTPGAGYFRIPAAASQALPSVAFIRPAWPALTPASFILNGAGQSEAKELSEEVMLGAVMFGHEQMLNFTTT